MLNIFDFSIVAFVTDHLGLGFIKKSPLNLVLTLFDMFTFEFNSDIHKQVMLLGLRLLPPPQ